MPIDYSRYPPGWKKVIRPRILERAGHCCEFCFLENLTMAWSVKYPDPDSSKKVTRWYPEDFSLRFVSIRPGIEFKRVKVVLTIAHLDHDESNWNVQDERLKALCQLCHLKYDAAEKKKRRNAKKDLG